jgi:hypothetical protein
LSGPVPSAVVYVSIAGAIVTGAAFLVGARYRTTAPAFAFLLTWVLSYRNSWGMIFHTENLLVLQVILLALSPAAAALSVDARGKKVPKDAGRFGWPVRAMCLVTTVAYSLAGIAKLHESGIAWITSEILRNYIAHDNVRKALLGDGYSPIGAWLIQFGWVFKPLAALTMIIELFAPLAVLSRRLGRMWVAMIWAFHVGVLATMWIFFPYQVLGIGFACFFDVEKLSRRVRARLSRRRSPASPPSREEPA